MKNVIIKKYSTMKQVFSNMRNNFQGSSRYPLGEDFYSFKAGDDSKISNISKSLIPGTKNLKF